MKNKKLAFIGAGNMAFAIMSGLIKNGYLSEKIIACNKSNQVRRKELEELGITVNLSNSEAVKQADVVILAVKPQVMSAVCAEFSDLDFSDKWVISVAAGISVDRLEALLPSAKNIIRTMPNTPSLIGEGVTGLFAKSSTDRTACEFAEALMEAVGKCYWVKTEDQLNQIIAITGSSPAYFFLFMEAMQQSAIKMGFSEQDARYLVQSVALGATKLVESKPDTPLSQLRENVTSKGGTTAEALAIFEQHHLLQTVDNAMLAAIKRAEEMEKSL
ncbi:pyrroline-5-carboxylate reductase [Phocoenobacter skyensis]|nr:pyrroline-5-carboxylate reductase [Pasteurella skyensis]MDP8080370.1 pyrroline-5-carboxylate reductase [Pasteurella skyensis]MDP8086360.1 pyrroline-5-carboxylate reductase [Pasteurella skyensis]MDP8186082.1 pyrroline-5-carboxylate reductase [Pasteurella skyensis]QLB23695.1 pyrroline-5-carboxylate reductase [Pasteurella skyensis]